MNDVAKLPKWAQERIANLENDKAKMLQALQQSGSAMEIVGFAEDGLDAPMGYVTGTNIPRRHRKVSIMGFAPSSMEDVRYVWDDPDMEVWPLNQMYLAFPAIVEKATRWVQIHPKHSYERNVARDHSHHEWLSKQNTFPIYMIERMSDVPMSVKWPKNYLMEVCGTDYFTNSISWMLALAYAESIECLKRTGELGFTDIHIFGVDMAQSDEIDSEYAEQRPSCEYFIGLCRGAGMKVHIPDKSDLLKTMWLYPYEDNSPFRTKMEARRVELRQRMIELSNQEEAVKAQRNSLGGAIENIHYTKRCWDQSINELKVQDAILKEYVEGRRKPITE